MCVNSGTVRAGIMGRIYLQGGFVIYILRFEPHTSVHFSWEFNLN